MLAKKNLRGFILLEMAFVYFINLVILIYAADIIDLGRNVTEKALLQVAVYLGMAGAALLIFHTGGWGKSSLGFHRNNLGQQILIGLGIFAVTYMVYVGLPMVLGYADLALPAWAPSSLQILFFHIFFDLVCVGLGEEIIYRGYFYSRFRLVFRAPWVTILLTSCLFGLCHYPSTRSFVNVVTTGCLGAIYALARHKLKNCTLLSLGIAHGFHDAAIVTLAYILANQAS
ncbi:MAG: CPBP family intramembrane metalloprotease [Clostridium sp.]|jgi:membrane protease YdiL (CAAX protease family)|nr:CPBP family intramembrane metalloprotease [Clostridium sp.]